MVEEQELMALDTPTKDNFTAKNVMSRTYCTQTLVLDHEIENTILRIPCKM